MSRKYCSVCGESHSNGGFGMCDKHLQEEEEARLEESAEFESSFENFMSRDEEDRWRLVFTHLTAQGINWYD